MNIRAAHLNDDGDLTHVDVKMTAAEAVFVAKLVGGMNDLEQNAVLREIGSVAGRSIYNALVGGLFNRYYDDGVDGAARHLDAATGATRADTEGP